MLFYIINHPFESLLTQPYDTITVLFNNISQPTYKRNENATQTKLRPANFLDPPPQIIIPSSCAFLIKAVLELSISSKLCKTY